MGSPSRVCRAESNLRVDGTYQPILRICADPGSKAAPSEIQIGFPKLPEVGSPIYFKLLQEWLRVCDKEHSCLVGSDGCRESDGLLPTRVIDVGDSKSPNSLQLYETSKGEQARYVALSHSWGKLKDSEREKFCTYICNVDKRRKGINWDDLPKTFQDAVTVTRRLGVRFLWIDSICIIQSHKNCSECSENEDWDIECKKMGEYFRSAYCTIAATSAKNAKEGFLECRSDIEWVKVPSTSESPPWDFCGAIDDFHRDVEEADLNKRGWVLQERVLSRRIIHFTSTQAYWECGKGVRCETLVSMEK
jgi:Heterokaryon incompatibility protein (HET)